MKAMLVWLAIQMEKSSSCFVLLGQIEGVRNVGDFVGQPVQVSKLEQDPCLEFLNFLLPASRETCHKDFAQVWTLKRAKLTRDFDLEKLLRIIVFKYLNRQKQQYKIKKLSA